MHVPCRIEGFMMLSRGGHDERRHTPIGYYVPTQQNFDFREEVRLSAAIAEAFAAYPEADCAVALPQGKMLERRWYYPELSTTVAQPARQP